MGDFATVALIGAGLSAAKQVASAAQAGRRADAEVAAQNNAVAMQLQQQAQAAQIEERRRQEQLKRDRAQRLARFGGQGLASTGGSADAVLSGLTGASARRGAENAAQRGLAMSSSLLDLADRNRLTLLRAAEERERAALGVAGEGVNLAGSLIRRGSAGTGGSGTNSRGRVGDYSNDDNFG
ncbi:MAG: hypothetical protein KIT16_19020 [Rhodospirillaceae bacterium]|nr:hypothetical protein [Rhodospirillaceae bacterium]